MQNHYEQYRSTLISSSRSLRFESDQSDLSFDEIECHKEERNFKYIGCTKTDSRLFEKTSCIKTGER